MQTIINNPKTVAAAIALILVGGAWYFSAPKQATTDPGLVNTALAAKFETLSQNGNSSCSGGFKDSIVAMADSDRLQGSCCSPMNMHRYSEQIGGLKAFKSAPGQNVPEIPDDPYDIEASLAKRLIIYYDFELTPDEQRMYDYAMLNSHENGPCCCKCWRWYVYGGLAKFLIRNHNFSGEQIIEVWDLSDGCGGEGDHVNH